MQNLQNNSAGVRDLIDTLIDRCGWSDTEVRQRARVLREAGLLPTSKRGGGIGKAPIKPEHCVWMMIAMGATDTNRRAAEAARLFARLKRVPSKDIEEINSGDLTFLGDLTKYLEWRRRKGFPEPEFHMETFVFQPDPDWPIAKIVFRSIDGVPGESMTTIYTPAKDDALERYEERFKYGQLTRPTQIDAGIVDVFTLLLGPEDRTIIEDPDAYRRWVGSDE
jgi:hypothetical protein